MKKYTKTAGLLFMAASSVYYGQAVVAAPAKSAPGANGAKPETPTNVRLLDDLVPTAPAAPAITDNVPAATNTETPAATTPAPAVDDRPADPATGKPPVDAPKPEGRSVSKSEVAVNDEGTVEIHVNDASLVEVLRMLSLQSQKNIVCSKDVRGTVTANLYNVTIREALDQILHMNGYAYREKGNFINVYTVKELQQIEDAERRVQTEVFRLQYTNAANVLTMVKPVLSNSGQASATTPAIAGVQSGGETGGNSHAVEDMLVVTDFPENLDKIRKLLKDVDRRPQQVLVEATILRASLSEDNALGVDFNVLAGVKFSEFTHNNGQITNANIVDGTTPSFPNNAGSIGTGNSFTSTVPGGMKVGFVSDNVSVFLAALEGVTNTTVMGNPKVLALNKQKGEVIVGRKDGYKTTTSTQTATIETVEFLDTGTRLIFRPFISEDGYVRMELHPEDSSGGLTGAGLPFKITTEMTSNIMVKDGHTVVIGGLFRESSDIARSQTPFLGNIPVAGALFRNQRDRTTREEIIILLTPHIIKDDEVYAQLSGEDAKRFDRVRVGVRKGMMPWGRERMAEGAYDKALAELNKPNPNNQKALWHLDCATNLNPQFIEAIELKQKVTGREVTAVDNSSIRSFVRDMVLADRPAGAVPTPPPGRRTGADKSQPGPTTSTADAADMSAIGEEPSDPFTEIDPAEEIPFDQFAPDYEPDGADSDTDGVIDATKPATTQPVARAASTQPTTQPTLAEGETGTGESGTAGGVEKKAPGEAAPATPAFTVTELPLEEVKPDAPIIDDNK
jgi:type IV pilus assembly protein PilQ